MNRPSRHRYIPGKGWIGPDGNPSQPKGVPISTGAKFRKAAWPLSSEACGVHPSQRIEAMRDAIRRGVPTEFDERGDAIFTSREHRRRYCQAYDLVDFDGGYGDRT